MRLFLKILNGIANSVDPDQTAPSGSALFAYMILSYTGLQKFRTFTVLSGQMQWMTSMTFFLLFFMSNRV